jgi:rare lipoprotein A
MRQSDFWSIVVILASVLSILSLPVREDAEKGVAHISAIRPPEHMGAQGASSQRASCADTRAVYQRGIASWYGENFHGRTMANGKPYDMHGYTVAHRTLRLGTTLCITNPANGRSVRATVTDRGPYVEPRIVDLSKHVADELGIGLGQVELSLI